MIRIDQLPFIPNLPYATYSLGELSLAKDNIEAVNKASEGIWVVSFLDTPLLVVGVIGNSLLNPPRLWFLLCENFITERVTMHLRALRNALDYLDEIYPSLVTYVEKDWAKGVKFAKFCGFRPSGREVVVYGRTLLVMER